MFLYPCRGYYDFSQINAVKETFPTP